MPKSSIATVNPSLRNRCSVLRIASRSCSRLVSVTSSSIHDGSQPARARSRRCAARCRRGENCRPERLTDTSQREAGPAPCRALFGRGSQHPVAERVDQARFLGQRDEDLRRDAAVLRIVPAQQRFRADDRAVVDFHDRLVVQPQPTFLERVAQRPLQRVLPHPKLREIGVEELVRVAPELLRAVHRDVGVLEQLLGVVGVVRKHADADRRGHVDARAPRSGTAARPRRAASARCGPAPPARRNPRRSP